MKLRAVEQKVKRYLNKLRNYKSNKELWAKTREIVKKAMEQYVAKRETRRTWMHVDLDMFYAACEIIDNPSLAKKPIAVGDNAMIQTTNYVARRYGVKSAMPGFIGRKLCPHLIFVRPNYKKYREFSDEFKRILS
jgi:DNA polymerase kappa